MLKKLLKILIIIIFCLLIFSKFNFAFAFAPKIVNKLNSSFNDIEKWCIKLATPAAAVSLAIGLFIKKFSFGDEERIRKNNTCNTYFLCTFIGNRSCFSCYKIFSKLGV